MRKLLLIVQRRKNRERALAGHAWLVGDVAIILMLIMPQKGLARCLEN
uniref:Uncharacterized protein n=1 Tax=Arundo donax TaxID=35708 RepID=A0A0A8XWN1_ARUDO